MKDDIKFAVMQKNGFLLPVNRIMLSKIVFIPTIILKVTTGPRKLAGLETWQVPRYFSQICGEVMQSTDTQSMHNNLLMAP